MSPRISIKNTHDAFLLRACHKLGYDDSVYELLLTASREILLELPLRKDDGTIIVYHGYRVQHHNARGPYKGGLRYHPNISMKEIRGLASLMSLKTSLVDIPLGGAKGGINCDPSNLSAAELESLTRKFVSKIHRNIGPNLDIPAPDIGTNAQIMAWIQDEYSKIYGYTPAVVTGKPIVTGGCPGREEATGRGVGIVMQEYAKHRKINLSGKTVVIQGFGNVGSHTAHTLKELEMKIIAVSDRKGGVVKMDGLDIKGIESHQLRAGTVVGAKDTEPINNIDLLELKCDFLVPAAVENVIDKNNADRIQAQVVVEAANSPVTNIADKMLSKRGIILLPDILVNAGGVIVSYFEWVQNLQQFQWPLKLIQNRLLEKLQSTARQVFERADDEKLPYRDIAYQIATQRLKEAIFTAGF